MKRNVLNLLLLFVLSLAFMSVTATAQASTERIPLAGSIEACNGEIVDYEGFYHIVTQLNVSNSGYANLRTSTNISLKGVGQTTGAKYVGGQTSHAAVRTDSLDQWPYVFTSNQTFNLNAQGNLPNTRLRTRFHSTVNANGEITSSRLETEVVCNP